jgi:hypothetical protein
MSLCDQRWFVEGMPTAKYGYTIAQWVHDLARIHNPWPIVHAMFNFPGTESEITSSILSTSGLASIFCETMTATMTDMYKAIKDEANAVVLGRAIVHLTELCRRFAPVEDAGKTSAKPVRKGRAKPRRSTPYS